MFSKNIELQIIPKKNDQQPTVIVSEVDESQPLLRAKIRASEPIKNEFALFSFVRQIIRYSIQDFPIMLHRWPLIPILGRTAINPLQVYPAAVLENDNQISYVVLYSNFIKGAQVITGSIWPAAFVVMMALDIFHYATDSTHRYLTTETDLVFAQSPNYDIQHSALTSHLGGDLPGLTTSFYGATLGIMGAAVLIGLVNLLLGLCKPFKGFSVRKAHDLEYRICWRKYAPRNHAVDREDSVDLDLIDLTITPEIENLKGMITNSRGLTQLIAIRTFANVYVHCMQSRRELMHELDDILRNVEENSDRIFNGVTYTYFLFQLWSRGVETFTKHPVRTSLFTIFVLPVLLAASIFWWKLIINKFIEIAAFNEARGSTKHYEFIPQIGNFAALECHWHEVPYPASKSLRLCIEYLLRSNNNIEDVLARLNQVNATTVKELKLDLSKFAWMSYSSSKWQEYFSQLHRLLPKQLQEFRLTLPSTSPITINAVQAAALSEFLRARQIQRLDMNQFPIGVNAAKSILGALEHATDLRQIILSGTQISSEGLESLQGLMNVLKSIQRIDVAGVNANGQSLLKFIQALPITVNELSLGRNPINSTDLQQIWQKVALLNINEWAVNGIDHKQVNYDLINLALTTGKFRSIHMEDTALDAYSLASLQPGFANSTVQEWHIAGNTIDGSGYEMFCQNVTLALFNVSRTKLSADGLNGLAACNLFRLDISKNPITTNGITNYFNNANSTLETLIADDCNLGDVEMQGLAQFSRQLQGLKYLSLRNNALSSNFSVWWPTGLTKLDLSNNHFDHSLPRNFTLWLENSNCTWLELENTNITGDEFRTLNQSFSKLTHLSLAYNPLSAKFIPTFVDQSIQGHPCGGSLVLNDDIDCNRAVMRAGPATQLAEIILTNTSLTEAQIALLCRIGVAFNIAMVNDGQSICVDRTTQTSAGHLQQLGLFAQSESTLFSGKVASIALLSVMLHVKQARFICLAMILLNLLIVQLSVQGNSPYASTHHTF